MHSAFHSLIKSILDYSYKTKYVSFVFVYRTNLKKYKSCNISIIA